MTGRCLIGPKSISFHPLKIVISLFKGIFLKTGQQTKTCKNSWGLALNRPSVPWPLLTGLSKSQGQAQGQGNILCLWIERAAEEQ